MIIYHESIDYNKLCIARTAGDQKKTFVLKGISSYTMLFEWGNETNVSESCTSFAIVRVITVRVMLS